MKYQLYIYLRMRTKNYLPNIGNLNFLMSTYNVEYFNQIN